MKTMKNFLSMAALALVGAVMTGCSNENDVQQPENNDKVLTLKTTISFDGATTRALAVDYDLKKGRKTFAVDDQIVVIYKDVDGRTRRDLSNELTALDISNEGKTADFTVTLTYTPGNNADVRYVYPAYMAQGTIDTSADTNNDNATIDYDMLDYQTGTLDDLGTNKDLATFDGNFSGTSLPTSASLSNRLAILALTLKNSAGDSNITSGLNAVTIDGSHSYVIAPKGGGTFGVDTIYVAIQPEVADIALNILAEDGTSNYYAKKMSAWSYAANTFYTLALKMPIYPIALNAVTSNVYVGSVITTDGYVYPTITDAGTHSKTAAAYIAYVGSDTGESSPYNHGLALALSDANGGNTCQWKTSNSDAGHVKQSGSGFTSESGLQYNDATHNSDTYPAFKYAMANNGTAAPAGCTAWFLPTGYQWVQMLSVPGDFSRKRTMWNLQSDYYWSSSEDNDNAPNYNAWRYYFVGTGGWVHEGKVGNYYVRSATAF